MATEVTARSMTVEEFAELPDDGTLHELVRGEVVALPRPNYQHGFLTASIGTSLFQHVREHDLGEVVAGDPGFVLAEDPATVRGPDVAFIAKGRTPGDRAGFARGSPDLAIEIVSPSDTYTRLQEKALEWLAGGARLVVAVDPRRRTATVYRAPDDIVELSADERLDASDVVAGWSPLVRELLD
ncbi:MAG: Uma2 family endonuclease [Solirubrobacteraceae bacterium MAG38_C4-C5]|nr:Uma2 family endonuclease [Candidatus Siliceabacter maunaloa]